MKNRAEIDRQTRELLKALKTTLLDYLGKDSVDPEFWTDLYWRLRGSLTELREGDRGNTDSSYCHERLAMDVYLTAVTHFLRSETMPFLLSDLEQNIAEALIPGCPWVGNGD